MKNKFMEVLNRNSKHLVFTLLFIPFLAFSQEASDIFDKCALSTVTVIMNNSQGSGFIVSDGKVVTNAHVIKNSSSGVIKICKQSYEYKITGYYVIDEFNDLVLLSVPNLKGKQPLEITTRDLKSGEKIFVIGTPIGFECMIDEGIFSGTSYIESHELMRISAPISPGSSGSPVIDKQGKLVGVARGSIDEKGVQNMNFAIPTKYVKKLLDNAGYQIKDLPGVYKPPPPTPPTTTYKSPPEPPKQIYRAPSGYECTPSNIIAFDVGLWFPNKKAKSVFLSKYRMDLNFRYTHNFSRYWGIDFIKFGGMFDFSEVKGGIVAIMVGACGYTPGSYDCKVSGTASFRLGGAYNTFTNRFGFCYEIELDMNLPYLFFGLTYNNFGFIGIKAGVNIGW